MNAFTFSLRSVRGFFVYALFFAISAVFLFGLNVSPANAGLGFSPQTLRFTSLLPNTTQTSSIVFSRSDAEKKTVLDVRIEGVASDYVSGSNEIVFEAGQQRVSYPVTISTDNLPSGTYEAAIYAITRQEQKKNTGGGSSASVILAAYPKVVFEVTNDIKQEYSISEVYVSAAEEQQPFGFSFSISVTGNVSARPARAEIRITSFDDPTFLYEETIDGSVIPLTKEFSTSEVGLVSQARLASGKYFIEVTLYDDVGDVIYKKEKAGFQIFPPGTLQQEGDFVAFSVDKSKVEQNELVGFLGVFKNTGTIGTLAALTIDLMKDGQRLDTFKTEQVFVPPNRQASFGLDKRFVETGKYTASGSVDYGIYTTDNRQVEIQVGGLSPLAVYGGLGVIVLVIMVAVLIINKKKKGGINPPSSPTFAQSNDSITKDSSTGSDTRRNPQTD